MIVNTKARYAVMAMVDLAKYTADKPIQIAAIAERQNIDKGYLEQLFCKLKKKGLVKAIRGPGGGYKIAKPINEITISEIIEAVNKPIKITRCVSDQGCAKAYSKCLTHDLWARLEEHIQEFLNAQSLNDLSNASTDLFNEKKNHAKRITNIS